MKPILLRSMLALVSIFIFTGACSSNSDSNNEQNLLLALLVLNELNRSPEVAMFNNSGGPQSYFMFTNSSCSGTATYEFTNPVSDGNTTSAITVAAGAYYFSIFGVLCTSSPISIESGRSYTCTATSSSVSCSGSLL